MVWFLFDCRNNNRSRNDISRTRKDIDHDRTKNKIEEINVIDSIYDIPLRCNDQFKSSTNARWMFNYKLIRWWLLLLRLLLFLLLLNKTTLVFLISTTYVIEILIEILNCKQKTIYVRYRLDPLKTTMI